MNRVIFEYAENENYWQAEKKARRRLDEALPFCERYGFLAYLGGLHMSHRHCDFACSFWPLTLEGYAC